MATVKGRTSLASESKTLKVGDTAPDFDLKTHADGSWKLSDHTGKNTVISFYPFAFTPT